MGCSRDSGCSKIAKVTYPKLREQVNNSIKSVNSELTNTVDTLANLAIPEDYLGIKVQEKVDEIIGLFNTDVTDLNTAKKSINTFIDEKISEHESHYQSWLEAQEEANNSDDGNTNE